MRSENEKRASRLIDALNLTYTLIYLAVGCVIICPVRGELREGASRGMTLLTLAGFLLALTACHVVSTLISNLGTYVGGRRDGWKFIGMRVMGLQAVRRPQGGIRFVRLPNLRMGGFCVMEPPDKRDGEYPFRGYMRGGWTANLVCAVAFGAAGALCPAESWPWAICLALALMNLSAALRSGVPVGSNDEARYRALRASRPYRDAYWVEMKAQGEFMRGESWRTLPEEWFLPLQTVDGGEKLLLPARVTALARLLLMSRFDEARSLAEALAPLASAGNAIPLRAIQAYLELMGENRRERVEELMPPELVASIRSGRFPFPLIFMLYAYALLYLNDSDLADRLRRAYEKGKKQILYPQNGRLEEEQMDLALEKWRSRAQ